MDMRTWRDSRSRADDATRVLRDALAVLGLPQRVQRNLRPMVTHSGTPFVHMGMVKAEHVERMTPPHVSRTADTADTADTEWQSIGNDWCTTTATCGPVRNRASTRKRCGGPRTPNHPRPEADRN